MMSLTPKSLFAVFHVFPRKSVGCIFSCNFCFTFFEENKVKYWTKSSRGKDYFSLIFEIRVCHFLVSEGTKTKDDKVGEGSQK